MNENDAYPVHVDWVDTTGRWEVLKCAIAFCGESAAKVAKLWRSAARQDQYRDQVVQVRVFQRHVNVSGGAIQLWAVIMRRNHQPEISSEST